MQFFSTVAASALLSLASGAVLGPRGLSGQATYYGGNLDGGACSFSTYTLPSDIFGTALSESNWDNSGNCGACVSVTDLAGKTITAMIVDECPGCGLNHLDLFPDAFSTLANPTTGVIDVTWSYIVCPITTPLQLHNKEGVSAYWFSMQVVNANKAVTSLEVSTDGGNTWQGTTRQVYNFFENSSGFRTTTVDVSSGESVTATSNFGGAAAAASSYSAVPVAASSTSITASVTTSTSVQPATAASATDLSEDDTCEA
jgi:expansin (peptidoglycan-binding protein)